MFASSRICHGHTVKLYETDLMESFKAQHLIIGGEQWGTLASCSHPTPGLADVRDDIAARSAHRQASAMPDSVIGDEIRVPQGMRDSDLRRANISGSRVYCIVDLDRPNAD